MTEPVMFKLLKIIVPFLETFPPGEAKVQAENLMAVFVATLESLARHAGCPGGFDLWCELALKDVSEMLVSHRHHSGILPLPPVDLFRHLRRSPR